MKKFTMTYFLISLTFIPAIFAQVENDKKTDLSVVESNKKSNLNSEEKSTVNKGLTDTKGNSTSTPPITSTDSLKPKFGSKEHRAKVEEAPSKIESTENILLKTCLALAGVIGLILLIFSILKKVNGRLNNSGIENPLRVKNKLMIDSKNYLALVRVYEEELLVSVGPNGTNLLTRYALVEKDDAEGTDFENILNDEGKSIVPADLNPLTKGVDIKSIRELKNEIPK